MPGDKMAAFIGFLVPPVFVLPFAYPCLVFMDLGSRSDAVADQGYGLLASLHLLIGETHPQVCAHR